MDNFSLFVVALLAGVVLVVGGMLIALLISPRSLNFQKGEPYECGLPTHGTSWMQFRVGYYLYAILFLMFDVVTIFLFPWSTVVRELGMMGFVSVLFFIGIMSLGLAYAWKKGVLKWTCKRCVFFKLLRKRGAYQRQPEK